jgi:hypothetical protein
MRLLLQLLDLPVRRGATDQQHRAQRHACVLRQIAGLTMDLDGQRLAGACFGMQIRILARISTLPRR